MRHDPSLVFLLLASTSLGAACAQGRELTDTWNPEPSAEAQTLQIQPQSHTLIVRDGVPATLDYRADLVDAKGAAEDVTAETTFSLDDLFIGEFIGPTFYAANVPGQTTVTATAREKSAKTSLTILVEKTFIAEGAPSDAPEKFGGPEDPARAPTVVYPDPGVLVPPNMNSLDIHFLPGSDSDLFELRVHTDGLTLRAYFPCTPLGPGCAFTPNAEWWKLVAEAGRGKEIQYTLRGTRANSPASVGSSAPRPILFAEQDIKGGVYYWNAGAGATVRYEFGVSGQKAELYMNAASAGATQCVGCHQLSRDGSRIAIGLDIPAPAVMKVYDTATKTKFFQKGTSAGGGGANFFSFFPDNHRIATSNGLWIDLIDADTGAMLKSKLIPSGTMPDVSPDGNAIAYARPTAPSPCSGDLCSATGVSQASLEIVRFKEDQWQPAIPLTPFEGLNNFYPSFSPEGSFILFNRAASTDSFEAKDAEVWAIAAEPGGKPFKLAKASTSGDVWPKWAPNVQTWKSGSLLWFTFSSRRPYGLRLAAGESAQIWMAAFDLARAKAGEDPSFPAFWLPFQEPTSGNHIAQWVTAIARRSCTTDSDCESSEACTAGLCIPVLK